MVFTLLLCKAVGNFWPLLWLFWDLAVLGCGVFVLATGRNSVRQERLLPTGAPFVRYLSGCASHGLRLWGPRRGSQLGILHTSTVFWGAPSARCNHCADRTPGRVPLSLRVPLLPIHLSSAILKLGLLDKYANGLSAQLSPTFATIYFVQVCTPSLPAPTSGRRGTREVLLTTQPVHSLRLHVRLMKVGVPDAARRRYRVV